MKLQDFLAKIDNEGGLDGAFVSYGLDPDDVDVDKKFDEDDKQELIRLVVLYINAANELTEFLEEFGYGEEE